MKSLLRFYNRSLAVLSLIILLFLAGLSLIFRVFISFDYREKITVAQNGWVFYLAVLTGGVLLLFLSRVISRVSERILFLVFSLVYLVCGVALIFLCAGSELRADQERIYYYALQFAGGDYSGLMPEKYLGWNPHQLGMLSYERLLFMIRPTARIVFSVNLLMVCLINYQLWQIVRLLTGGASLVCKYTIVLSFLFVPQFFYILFAYGQIPGLCCIMAAVWSALIWQRKGRPLGMFGCAVFCAFAVLLKPNYGIAVIAICLTIFAGFFRDCKKGRLAGLALIIAGSLAAKPLLLGYYENVSGIKIEGGIPVSSYLVMGLQTGEEGSCGWFNSYNVDVYTENGFDHDLADRISREEFTRSIKALAADPSYAGRFFFDKLVSTWCDPLFESVWIGPWSEGEQSIRPAFLAEFYHGKNFYPYLAGVMNVLVFLILAGGVLFVAGSFKKDADTDPVLLLPVLYLTGGFVYHLISETSSQYVYMYVFCLIPYAAVLFARWGSRLTGGVKHREKKHA